MDSVIAGVYWDYAVDDLLLRMATSLDCSGVTCVNRPPVINNDETRALKCKTLGVECK